jgi:hypothetical protein
VNAARAHTDGERHDGDTDRLLRAALARHDGCQDQARTLIRLHLAGIPATVLRARLLSEDHGAFSDNEISAAMQEILRSGFALVDTEGRWHQALPDAPVPLAFLAAADAHRRAFHPSLRERARDLGELCFGRRWWKLWLMTALLLATVGGCMRLAHGQDVPAWVLRGIAAVETGTDWRDMGDVRGSFGRGAIGEVGPWQLSPSVLRDLRAYDRRYRVHADVVLAESLTRAWLLRLHAVTGTWPSAIAAYHAGLGNRRRSYATDYAQRVQAAGAFGAPAAD